MSRLILFVALAFLGGSAQQQSPPRDLTRPAARRTGAIVGRVLDARTQQPIRLARVHAKGPAPSTDDLETATNGDGRFELRDLPEGLYSVTAERNGYLQMQYGQRQRGEPGKAVRVLAGAVERIDLGLPAMGVISGHVADESGAPVHAMVSVARRRSGADGGRLEMVATTMTDDLGEYDLFNLEPDAYFLLARSIETHPGDGAERSQVAYLETYYPSGSNPAAAKSIPVKSGDRIRDIDLSLLTGRAARISGVAFDSHGFPMNMVSAMYQLQAGSVGVTGSSGRARVGADGRFTLTDVPPGAYTVIADGDTESTSMPLVVEGADIDGLELRGTPGWSMSGRVLVDGAPPKARIPIGAVPDSDVVHVGRVGDAFARSEEDGTFVVPDVVTPSRLVTLGGGPSLYLEAVMHDGHDVTGALLDSKPGQRLANFEIRLTSRPASLAGQVTSAPGVPADATVIVFATLASRWYPRSPFIHAERPDTTGEFTFKGLTGGDYFVIALDHATASEYTDPAFLTSLMGRAQKVTLTDSQLSKIDLTVVGR